jgi:LacI family transcriptional regulator
MTGGQVTDPRVRLVDVAQRAGVSRTTASFVLTGRRDMRISADAQQRVLQAARELSYRPNLLARSLRTNMSQTIGLISDVIASEPFAGDEVRGCLATALQHQHLLFVGETEGDKELEKQLIQDMLDRGVSGFIYGSMYTRRTTVPRPLRDQPVVMMNCLPRGRTPTLAVIPDERAAGRTAVDALLEAGHTDRIYLVGETPDGVIAGVERHAGISAVLASQGLELAGWVSCLWWPGPAQEAVTRLLESGAQPTALICLNDRVAMGAYHALRHARLTIPHDVSVISFDDSDLASWLEPGLTSIALPHYELGRQAVELLMNREGSGVHRIPMELRARASVGPPRRRRPRPAR